MAPKDYYPFQRYYLVRSLVDEHCSDGITVGIFSTFVKRFLALPLNEGGGVTATERVEKLKSSGGLSHVAI